MGSFQILSETTTALRQSLWNAFNSEDAIRQIVPGIQHISLSNPTETLQQADKKLSLWLYRIEENDHLKNRPVQYSDSPRGDVLRRTPLSLDLWYLVTPTTPTAEWDQLLLGRAMLAFHDEPVLDLRAGGVVEEVRVVLGRISLEELTRVWEALNQPYRLSVCYVVRVTEIDSTWETIAPPIVESTRGYGRAERTTTYAR